MHSYILVVTNGSSIESLMEPYDENLEIDKEDCEIERSREDIIRDGEKYAKILLDCKTMSKEEYTTKYPDKYLKGCCTTIENALPYLDKYEITAETTEEEKFYNLGKDCNYGDEDEYFFNEDGDHLYRGNPNARWDWYTIGGRWPNMLKIKIKDGCWRGVDMAPINAIDWEATFNKGIKKKTQDYLKLVWDAAHGLVPESVAKEAREKEGFWLTVDMLKKGIEAGKYPDLESLLDEYSGRYVFEEILSSANGWDCGDWDTPKKLLKYLESLDLDDGLNTCVAIVDYHI